MTPTEEGNLKAEIAHIFESGANEIRIFEMIKNHHYSPTRIETQSPQAFPMMNELGNIHEYGMDLRDYFAAKNAQGILSTISTNLEYDKPHQDGMYTVNGGYIHFESVAKDSYELADAMLKARNQNPQSHE